MDHFLDDVLEGLEDVLPLVWAEHVPDLGRSDFVGFEVVF
jgi:hypothetical protein